MSGMQVTLRNERAEEDGQIGDDAAAAMDDDVDEGEQRRGGGKPRVVITTRHGAAAAAAASGSSGASSASAPRRVVKTKGRGFQTRFESQQEERYAGKGGEFESIEQAEAGNAEAVRSVEGYILVVTGLHEESSEDDLYELFADHGDVKQMHLNLDRRTGYVKGYALIEYGSFKEAQSALQTLNGHLLHEKALTVDWAFKAPPGRGGAGRSSGAAARQQRSSTGRGPRDEGRGRRD